MKLAFVSLAAPGHLNPMTTLARQMKTRGHDVVFSSFPDTEGFARAADLPFVPLCEKEYPVGSVAKLLEPLARLQGRAAMEFTFRLLADVLQNEINDFPHTMAACRAEAVVLDEADTFLSLVPMHLRMPTLVSRMLCRSTSPGRHRYVSSIHRSIPRMKGWLETVSSYSLPSRYLRPVRPLDVRMRRRSGSRSIGPILSQPSRRWRG
jgi:hypothetical protein